MADKVKLTVQRQTKSDTYEVRPGLGLLAIAKKHGLGIEFDCCKADCGICILTIEKGLDQLSKPTPSETDFLKAMFAKPNERLACQSRVFGDVTISFQTFE